MRWIILALSLGTFILSVGYSMLVLFGYIMVSSGAMPLWLVVTLTIASAIFAMIGGIAAFKYNRTGSVYLMLGALLCIVSPPEFWICGSLYLVATALCFFLPRRSDFPDDGDDYEKDEIDDPEEELTDLRELRRRRREQPVRVASESQEKERTIPLPAMPEELPKVRRRRTSKTCPTCGANVAIDNRYCPNCGSSLHIPADSGPEGPTVPESPKPAAIPRPEERKHEAGGPVPDRGVPEVPPSVSIAGSAVPPSDAAEDGVLVGPVGPAERAGGPLYPPETEEFQVTTPHKVFVKPMRENTAVPTRPLSIDPDASYQEFSQYARRRKRRTRSLGRRISGILILLGVIGGTTWFLLGLRKLPENQLPVRLPVKERVVESQTPVSSPVKSDDFAQPVGRSDKLPSLTIREKPERGRVTGSNVNLREDHSTASKSVVRLQTNAQAEILDTWEGTSGTLSGVWYRVRTGDNREGWIYGQYFLPMGEALPKGYTDVLLRSFGANRTEMTAALGQPARSKGSSLSWQGLTVTLSGDTVVRLQLTSSGRELGNGVRVGMTQAELLRTIGYPYQLASGQWRYAEPDGRGMSVQFGKDGTVRSVTVGKP